MRRHPLESPRQAILNTLLNIFRKVISVRFLESLHEKAFQLLRLIAANYSFVDGNKRTALHVDPNFLQR